MVVCTFLDAYDLSGKVVVPFMTYGATTYLNGGMQKLFKCTPNSIHVPAELPEDIDPDNIRQPQNDDDGIDVPNRASQVEEWLDRMGAAHIKTYYVPEYVEQAKNKLTSFFNSKL